MATKPPLHLSLSPVQPKPAPRSPSPLGGGKSSTQSGVRRITSWGSHMSEGGSSLSLGLYGDKDMTPLPSPVASMIHREDPWHTATLNRSLSESHRNRGNSISSEVSTSSQGEGSKSKTASFFSPAMGALSPPPNPPSRAQSLAERRPRKSWLDPINDESPPTAPDLPRTTYSPSHSPVITAEALNPPPRLPPMDFTIAQPFLPLAREKETPNPPPPPLNTKPQLAAIQTSALQREAHHSHLPSALPTALHRPMSSLPTSHPGLTSESSPIVPPSARFLKFGPPSRFATMDVHPSIPAFIHVSPSRLSASSEVSTRVPTPTPSVEESDGEDVPDVGAMIGEYRVDQMLGKGSFSRVALGRWKGKGREGDAERRVALKLISKKSYDGNERMRISVVREVEVLKRIRHPSLVTLITTYTTPEYTVLVLDFAPGGELFDFLAAWHTRMSEALVRRIFGELCQAVGWMHSILLVHRDIKLESTTSPFLMWVAELIRTPIDILLTARPFPQSHPDRVLDDLPTPFVKLTDFGLSRFISRSSPTLETRCGSEAYAAPELIMGKKYDGRRTDAWALGVVLFALITGGMPFVEDSSRSRKGYLLKIAKGDYRWPSNDSTPSESSEESPTSPTPTNARHGSVEASDATRLVTREVKEVVGHLLVRDAEKRATVDQLWDFEWMRGEGRPNPVEGWVTSTRDGEAKGDEPWAREA